jgi:hypothetical protein
MPTILLLAALVSTEPSITRQDLAQACPVGQSAALVGAPTRCTLQAQTMAQLTNSLKSLQRQLEYLLKHSAPELK